MDKESTIRSRIETVLLDDARRYAELRQYPGHEEPLWLDPASQQRGLYEGIIASCRRAVSEVNALLEENIEFLSGFCRIVEAIKEKTDLEEICVDVATCALQDFRAEYCAIILFEDAKGCRERFCIEAIYEGQSILRMHTKKSLLGSPQFEAVVTSAVAQSGEYLNSQDVYRDPRFSNVDWPSVVRSLACIPVDSEGKSVGALVLAHSIPSSFRENHFRVLRILAGMIAHLRRLTDGCPASGPAGQPKADAPDSFSVVLFSFYAGNGCGSAAVPDHDTLREVRRALASTLQPSEPILPHGDAEFLVLLPGTDADHVSAKVGALRASFKAWRTKQSSESCIGMDLGFSTCRSGESLSRVVEIASAVMHPESDE